MPIAIKLSGTFKTAFSEGKPVVEEKWNDGKHASKPHAADDAKPDSKSDSKSVVKADVKADAALTQTYRSDRTQRKTSAASNNVVLAADADSMNDAAAAAPGAAGAPGGAAPAVKAALTPEQQAEVEKIR